MGERVAEVERIILTASGGPFRDWPTARMASGDAGRGAGRIPNWDMGERISIDSATMFNKALEMIEAQALFDVNPERIEVLVHPQSIVHSMVGFRDGSIIAQLGPSDMRGAIGFALNWPERRPLPVERLDFAADRPARLRAGGPGALSGAAARGRGAGAGRARRCGLQCGEGGRARRLPRRSDRLP